MLPQIYLITPAQVLRKQHHSAAAPQAARFEKVEIGSPHIRVSRQRGDVVRGEQASQAASSAARTDRVEITLALKATDVRGFAHSVLELWIQQPGTADECFEGLVGEVSGEVANGFRETGPAGVEIHRPVFWDVDFEDRVARDQYGSPLAQIQSDGIPNRSADR